MSTPPIGSVLAGKYRVTRILGEGGMGIVVEAIHLQLDDRVAIKFLRSEALGSQQIVARFAREARAAIRIKSEHVARVIDVGVLDDGAPYMVMEYLEGRDLEAELARTGPLPLDYAVDLVLQACEALAEAHSLGIVHRDLKPANLFLTQRADGSALLKVLDFGISKTRSVDGRSADPSLTQTSAMLGSPMYMAPEQMSSAANVDARTDVWALGTILFELLTGTPPFTGDTIEQLAVRISRGDHLRVESFRDDIPGDAIAVITRCLQTDAAQRFADLAEFSQALAPFGSSIAAMSIERIRRVVQGNRAELRSTPASSMRTTPRMTPRESHTPDQVAMLPTQVQAPQSSSTRKLFVGIGLAATVGVILFLSLRRDPQVSQPSQLAASESAVAEAPVASTNPAPASAPVAPSAAASGAASTEPIASVDPPRPRTASPVPRKNPGPGKTSPGTSQPDLFDTRR